MTDTCKTCMETEETGVEILKSICYGLVCGLSEFFPISVSAHRSLFCLLTGTTSDAGLRFFAHCGCLFAVLLCYARQVKHIRREVRIAGAKEHRRMRQPDRRAVVRARTVLYACIPMVPGILISGKTAALSQQLWLMALLLFANGMLLYIPQFLPDGELDERRLTPLDGILFGVCNAISVLPGISRVSTVLLAGQIRGLQREHTFELSCMLAIPWLCAMLVADLIAWFAAGISGGILFWLGAPAAALAAFGAACGAITAMRFLSVRIGFHAFSFYCWGISFACMLFYLMI